MKGKKPAYEERKLIERAGLDTYEWLVQKDTSSIIQLVHRYDNQQFAVFDKETLSVIKYRKGDGNE